MLKATFKFALWCIRVPFALLSFVGIVADKVLIQLEKIDHYYFEEKL